MFTVRSVKAANSPLGDEFAGNSHMAAHSRQGNTRLRQFRKCGVRQGGFPSKYCESDSIPRIQVAAPRLRDRGVDDRTT